MKYVYLLVHVREKENYIEEEKIIGIYSSEEKAKEMIEKYKKSEEFSDCPEGFGYDKYPLDESYWEEGFTTVYY